MRTVAERFGGASNARVMGVVGPALVVVLVQLVLFPVSPGVWLQGMVVGLLNALVVLGMMLVYRANRVLNLAQASIGTLPAALGVGVVLFGAPSIIVSGWLGLSAGVVVGVATAVLARQDRGRAALVGIVAGASVAALVAVAGSGGYFGGLAVGLVAAVALGLAVDLIVVRRFRRSPRLVLTVATIGLAQLFAVGSLLVPSMWGRLQLIERDARFEVPGGLRFDVGDTVFRGDEIFAVVVALVCLVSVAFALSRTDVGIAARAAAERGDRAAMLGIPVARIEAGVWVVASVLAFLGSYLQAGVLGVDITTGVGLRVLVAALAAMALAGFNSLPSALTSAVAIGVLTVASGPAGGNTITTTDAALAAVVVIGLLARTSIRRRTDQGDTSSWQASIDPPPLPLALAGLTPVRVARWVLGAVALATAVALPAVLTPSQDFRAAVVASLAVVVLSVVVLTGWTGEVSLGQMAFAAVGAAVTAVATVEWQFDLTLALLVAGLAAALVAVLVGLPSLRWQGIFLAVTTLAFAVAAMGWFLNPTQATWIPRGAVLRRPLLGVWELDDNAAMYWVCLGVLVLSLLAVAGVRRSRTGRVLRAVRDNAPGAQAFGVRLVAARLTAFALSGFLAGVGGGLMVYVSEAYDVGSFSADQGLNIFITAVVGGVGSSLGAILGAVVLDGSRTFLSGPWVLLPSALGVLVVLIALPGGLAELAYRLRDRALRLVAQRRGISLDRPDVGTDAPGADTGHRAAASPTEVGVEGADVAPGTLTVRGLDVAYDKVQVLFGVDLVIRPGEITALLGTNGAGKSTLLRAIGGVAPVTAGSIHLGDVDLRAIDPDQVAQAGIAQMPGGAGVFPSLTVDENLKIAAWGIRRDGPRVTARLADVRERFPVLAQRASLHARDLSGGQQQQLALAMALLGEPRLLLIDELSLGLAPVIVEQLLEELRVLREGGTTIVIVEQSVNVALGIADHAYFMEKGSVRFSGSAADLLAQPDLVRAIYLQGARDALAGPGSVPSGATSTRGDGAAAGPTLTERSGGLGLGLGLGLGVGVTDGESPALETRGLTVHFGGITAVDTVDVAVAQGEIVGLIGPNGAGKTTMFDLICGFTAADTGRILLHGRDLSGQSPSARARAGLGRSFQNARLFPGLTVGETIATALERWNQAGDPVSGALRLPASQITERAVVERVDELMEIFGLTHLRQTRIAELSTGSRRMVDLACVVGHQPSVVLLDEPTSGIAQREAEALGPVLVTLRERLGASMLIIEHDIALIASVSDRLVALDSGAVIAVGRPREVLDHPSVVASYLGTSEETRNRSHQLNQGQ